MGTTPAINQFKKIKGIVFDLDDTLYLQKNYKESGFYVVARWLSAKVDFTEAEILEKLHQILDTNGPSYPFMFNLLIQRLALPRTLLSESINIFQNHSPKIECFPGVHELLRYLKDKYKLGLLTDGTDKVQREKVRSLHLENIFDEILYSNSVELEKPAPELYMHFESKFGYDSEKLVYIGDNPHKDFIEANKRGWLTIRVLTGEYTQLKCCGIKNADFEINVLKQLFSLL